MPLILSSVPTVHSRFANHHRPYEASLSMDSIAEMEREYAVARARAEALRSRLAQQQRARQLQAAFERDDLFGNYVVSNPSVAYCPSYRPHFSGSIPPYNPLGRETNIYPGHSACRHAIHHGHYICDPHDQHDFVHIQAVLQERAYEATRARYLANLNRQQERERARSILFGPRSQYDEAAERRAMVEAQLQPLLDPIIGSLLSDIETQPQGRKVNCSGLHPHSRSSLGVPRETVQDTTKEQAEYRTHPLLSLLVPPTSQSAPVPKAIDRKGKGRETPAIPFPKFPQPAVSESTTGTPTGSFSLDDELLKRKAVEKDVDVQDTLNGLLSKLLGIDIDLKEDFDAARAPAPSDNPRDNAKTKSVHFVAPEQELQATPFETRGPVESKEDNGPHLHRTPALSPIVAQKLLEVFRSRRVRKLSLGTIQEIEDQLHRLEASFVFPPHLDFPEFGADDASGESPTGSDPEFKLAFTPNNKVIHAYEHALNELLTKLDAVESQGDVEIRGRRKEVVGEIEKALDQVLRKVEDSRERASLSDTQIEVNAIEHQEEVVPTHFQVAATIQSEEIVSVKAQDLTTAEIHEGTESHISENLAIGQSKIGSHIFTPEETADASETLTAAALGTHNVEDEAYFGHDADAETYEYGKVAEQDVEVQSEGFFAIPSAETPFFEVPTESVAPVVNVILDPVAQVAPTPFDAAPSNVEPTVQLSSVLEDVTITSEVLHAEVAREDVAIQASPLEGETEFHAPAEVEDVANVVIQQVTPTMEELEASPSDAISPIITDIETSPAPAPPITPTTLSDIPFPLPPDPSESSVEPTDEDSFLLQTSPLADPEPRKAAVNNDEDEDIDVLSAGDLEERDEWSEVEA